VISVLFFAKYREQLGTAKICIESSELAAENLTVAELKAHLSQRGDLWATVLNAENTLCAVNQDIADSACFIREGDEIAFYPPVTGG